MMTSPVIDEEIMIDLLKPVPADQIGQNAVRLRTGATLLLLDAFDRKVTRDQFIAAMGSVVEIIDMLGRYEAFSNVKEFEADKGRVTKVDIEVAIAGTVEKIAVHTEQCAKMAELVHQCALNEDKVH
jgi:hypothetical protein